MRPKNTPETFIPELRAVSSAEIARIIQDAQWMRAEAVAELLRSAGRFIARPGRALAATATARAAHGGMKNA
jgi:hypothetical protein